MKGYIFFYLFLSVNLLSAQEVISDLIHNQLISAKPFLASNNKQSLSLPFFDDFSYNSSIVDSALWQESSVFVNTTYPINPPTIGVATFDGLDGEGLARDLYSINLSEPSDTLLSKVIDLSASSSVYFMFYFQAQGMGDAPQLDDKLILEFLNDTSGWEQVWSSFDTISTEFVKVIEVISASKFLHDSFQFRFRNYATISGNFDHWHLDYIKLDELLSISDTTLLNDVAFVYNSPSLLERYYEMPWKHFLNNEDSELKDSIDLKLRNNHASTNVDYQYNVFENNNQIFHYPTVGFSRNVSILDYDSIGNFSFENPPIDIQADVFSSFQNDSASFIIQNIIGTALSDNKLNDTLYHTQHFHSHFSYDDGTAESAYGININGAKLAYEFKLNRPDTLRAIQMYFPQMLDAVNHIPFKLTIWDNISGSGNIIYQQEVSPVHTENGAYHTYYLDSIFQLVGTFYVGWEQMTNDLLNIGLDKNNEANDYMYYNVGAGWVMSSYPGSWMIRPLLSMDEIVSSIKFTKYSSNIYPNPASSTLYIETSNPNNTISIYSMQGLLVHSVVSHSSMTILNTSGFLSGVYFVEILNHETREFQKIIIR